MLNCSGQSLGVSISSPLPVLTVNGDLTNTRSLVVTTSWKGCGRSLYCIGQTCLHMHYGLTGEDGNTDIIPAMNVQVTTSEAGTRPIAGSVACGTIGATPINTFLGSNYLPGSKTTQVEVQVTGLSHLAAGSYNGTIYVIAVVY